MPLIRQQHEARIIVPAGELAREQFLPGQLYNLLQGRAVRSGLDGVERWYMAQRQENGVPGILQLEALEITGRFDLEAALKRAGIENIGDNQAIAVLAKRLADGEAMQVTMVRHGVTMERVVFADPANNRIAIDLAESKQKGLYRPVLKRDVTKDLEKYMAIPGKGTVLTEQEAQKNGILKKMNEEDIGTKDQSIGPRRG
jgi:hypothetical protein